MSFADRSDTDSTDPPTDIYTHGHHKSVVASHAKRTADDSAAFFVPFLADGMRLLDVGCGPGTITCDFARYVAEVVGLEPSGEILDIAIQQAETRAISNVTFEQGSVYNLAFADGYFDACYAHQVLQHLSDPVTAIKEMLRVTKPGGLVAIRDADYRAMAWYPQPAELERWTEIYQNVCRANSAEPDAGRHLLFWALQAGVPRNSITATASNWLKDTPIECQTWGETWSDRLANSAFARQAVEYNLASTTELDAISSAWKAWASHDAAWFMIPHGELLIRKP